MLPDVIARVRYYDVSAPKRDFYSSAQKDDYLGYIDKGVQSTKAINYLDYTDDGEKSLGAFNAEGLLTKSQKKELREKLRTTQSCIWDMVVSFEESYGKIRPEALDTFKAEIVKHFMQPTEGIGRVRKLLTDRAQAVVSQPYTAYSFTLKRRVKLLYGKIPYEGKIGYESENMRHCRESVDAITNCILKNGRSKIAYEKLTAELAETERQLEQMEM